METFKFYIVFLIISLLLISVNSNVIENYNNEKLRIKREETVPGSHPDEGQPKTDTDHKTSVESPHPSPAPTTTPPVSSPPVSSPPVTTPTPSPSSSDKDDKEKTKTTDPSSNPTSSPDNSQNDKDNNKDDDSNNNDSNDTKDPSEKNDDNEGLSGGLITVIVLGGIFALGVVVLIFRAILKLFTRRKDDTPLPVLNVVGNSSSTEILNQPVRMSNEALADGGQYYDRDQQQQYYGQQGYNNGVDMGNLQYQSGDYQNNYSNQNYPQQDHVVQPVRQFSSLRRPGVNGVNNNVPPENYENMMNGEITDANQVPRKTIINKTNNTPIEPGTIHKTQFPFTPNMDDELKLNAGDAVEIIEVYDDGWSYGRNIATSEVGVFPISYITGYNDPANNF